MGFEQFGIVSFTGVTKTEKFVEFLKNNELRGTECTACGAKFFPPRSDCPVCFSAEMSWFKVAPEGKLLTFTKAMYAPAGFEKDVPYFLGVADFGDGVKVFGRIDKTIDEESIKPGMDVKVRIVPLDGDRFTYELTK